MLIHKDALALTDVVAKYDAGRYYLSGMLFDAEGRAVVTDGHVLVRFASNQARVEDFPKVCDGLDLSPAANVIVSKESLKSARTAMPTRATIPILNYFAIVPNGDHVDIVATDLDRAVRITARKIEGEFPKYEKVLTVDKPVRGRVILDPGYLELIGRVAKAVGAHSVHFTLHGDEGDTDILSQLTFTAQTPNGTLDGAVMPMRA